MDPECLCLPGLVAAGERGDQLVGVLAGADQIANAPRGATV